MIVEQTQDIANEQEGQDQLAGWRALDNFMLAYIKEHNGKLTMVGLFRVSGGQIQRGQRKVKAVEVNLGTHFS